MKLLRFFALAICCSPSIALSGKAHHVVVIVWDGMRPDFVSENHTPTLWKLAREGVTFRRHHSAYLSATVVNGTAIATGCYPSSSGVFANYVFRPEIDPAKLIDAGDPAVVRKGDEWSGRRYLSKPTIAEILHPAGKCTAIAGTKYITLLHDRRATPDDPASRKSFIVFQGRALPNEAIDLFGSPLGSFPGLDDPRADDWTTNALTQVMWKENVPDYSLLWLREPDYVQHKTSPGSPASLAAIQSADKHLADVLVALQKKNARNDTDVFIVSDHGFSTIGRSIDLLSQLNRAGFRVVRELTAQPQKGEIMIIGNGGSVLFYIIGHDADVTHRLVKWLQQTDFAGVIFSREKIEGTFELQLAKIDMPSAPDVVMAFRWSEQLNQFGVAGMIDADWNRKPGAGTHATLGKFDMHNMLIAAGPDFRRDVKDELPTGNTDLAPTILRILDVDPPEKMDGRILREAMAEGMAEKSRTKTIVASRDFEHTTWRQYLKISQVNSTVYFDEGNGSLVQDH